jgi:hypothetical protein
MKVPLDLELSFGDGPIISRCSSWRYKSALVAEGTITSYTYVPSNSLSEYFDTKNIPNDLLRLPLNVRVNQRNIVIASDDIAERR